MIIKLSWNKVEWKCSVRDAHSHVLLSWLVLFVAELFRHFQSRRPVDTSDGTIPAHSIRIPIPIPLTVVRLVVNSIPIPIPSSLKRDRFRFQFRFRNRNCPISGGHTDSQTDATDFISLTTDIGGEIAVSIPHPEHVMRAALFLFCSMVNILVTQGCPQLLK